MELKVDPEFEQMIPRLTDEEYEQLEENIVEAGVMYSPIITWQNTIIDGHNRYRILKDHPEISYETHEMDFSNRYEALAWICKNQLGRRNLTPERKRYLIGRQYEAEKKSYGSTERFQSKKGKNLPSGTKYHLGDFAKTGKRIAKETGMSDKYVRNAAKYARGVDAAEEVLPGIKEELLSGSIKPSQASVEEIAIIPIEERTEKAEQLRNPQNAKYKKTSSASGSETANEAKEPEDPKDYGIYLASDESILYEMRDALDDLVFRWDKVAETYPHILDKKQVREDIRPLVKQGISYFETYLENYERQRGIK